MAIEASRAVSQVPPRRGWTGAGARSILSPLPMASPPSRGVLANLLQILDRPGPLLILPHDNPDPDAMASAAALKYLAHSLLDKPARIALGGIVGRAENRAMRTY